MADPVSKIVTVDCDVTDWTDDQEDILIAFKEEMEAESNASFTYVVNIVPRPKKLPH